MVRYGYRTPLFLLSGLLWAGLWGGGLLSSVDPAYAQETPVDSGEQNSSSEKFQLATLGSGCFWCTEAVYQQLEGVESVVSGYSGGTAETATYPLVSTGRTRHAEVVQVKFDPQKVSYEDILEVFWKSHDPTTPNRQGPDVGPQYRSVIFYHNQEQKQIAEAYKLQLIKSRAFRGLVVTQVAPFEAFYPAEEYHQNYFVNNPQQRYCQMFIAPKVHKFRKEFPGKLKEPTDPKVMKSDVEWRKQLTAEQFRVTRRAGTEDPFTGAYWNHKQPGAYHCICCQEILFTSDSKFDSGTGWPSYTHPAKSGNVSYHEDRKQRMQRVEVRCATCEAHLGHVFDDGPAANGFRYCINSAALDFQPGPPAASSGKPTTAN